MLYDLMTTTLSERLKAELKEAKIHFLSFSLGVISSERIRNENIKGTNCVRCFGDKARGQTEMVFNCGGSVNIGGAGVGSGGEEIFMKSKDLQKE